MIEPVQFPATVTVALEGVLEPRDWERLRDQIVDAAIDGVTALVIDMSEVTFFDSNSIRGLLNARKILRARGVAIYFGALSEPVQRVVDITNLDKGIPFYSPG